MNITPLVAYLNAPFRYQFNVTDPDLVLRPPWACDFLSWTTNTSTFNITSGATCGEAGGLISFTPTGAPRNETINLTVTDTGGLSDARLILLEVRNNTPPRFNATFPTLACSDDQPCILNLSAYATDDDPGDYVAAYAVAFVNGTLGSFSLNATTGLVNFTPQMAEIGTYTADIIITDTRGATASQPLPITVNNTPHPPVWAIYDFSGATIVQDHQFNFLLAASDKDLLLPNSTEQLSVTTNASWALIINQSIVNDMVYFMLSFTPNASMLGNQSLALTVTDTTNLTNTTIVNFTVLAKSTPPSIITIAPYGDAAAGNSLVRAWKDVTGAPAPVENVRFAENTSDILFALNVTDAVTPSNQLSYTWFYDDAVVQPAAAGANSYTRSFDFFSDGNHTLVAVVNNTRLESASWTWNLSIAHVNRPPVLENNLTTNLSVDSTTTYTDYFLRTDTLNRFFDPDDDLNSDGIIDGNETSTSPTRQPTARSRTSLR